MLRSVRPVAFVIAVLLSRPAFAQSDIQNLFSQLSEPTTSDRAVGLILKTAKESPAAKAYVLENLPAVIERDSSEQVQMNAIKLAGHLRAPALVSPLIRVLPHSPYRPSVLTFGRSESLDSDPVGKALCLIGDPAIPALVRFMSTQADQDNRWRAARILSNINTPASRIALQEDLKHETDPRIKALAERKS